MALKVESAPLNWKRDPDLTRDPFGVGVWIVSPEMDRHLAAIQALPPNKRQLLMALAHDMLATEQAGIKNVVGINGVPLS